MRDRASATAAWVAAWRGLGGLLGEARLVDDPFGAAFGGAWAVAMRRAAASPRARRALLAAPGVAHWVGYLQVRTRALDDELAAFAGDGGEQVVLLGAGYDCRAARWAGAAGRDGPAPAGWGAAPLRVFEVDHPATQRRKRAVLAAAGADAAAAYVPWDFEARPLADLPATLAARGLDPRRRTLTIWEGVTTYLSAAAIDATLATVPRLGAAGSRLAFTYVEREALRHPVGTARLTRLAVARVGEPFRWGWDPGELPGWLAARGFSLLRDRSERQLAAALLPDRAAAAVGSAGRHVAVAEQA